MATLLMTAMLLLVQQGGYSFPKEALARLNGIPGVQYLRHDNSLSILFSWHDASKQIKFKVRRYTPQTGYVFSEKVENVSFILTAVTPKYFDRLYVIGVNEITGQTVIEKWTVALTLSGSLAVTRDSVLTSLSLTHIRAAAISPNEDFILAQRHESGEVIRISLPSGAVTTVLTTTEEPNLATYNTIDWCQHITAGHAFLMTRRRDLRPIAGADNSRLILWDPDLDGIPNSHEEKTLSQWESSGLANYEVWYPKNTFYDD